jgi:sulfane dehydrogenase subunit SoxC
MTTKPQDTQIPQLDWETHKIQIKGLVENPRELSCDDLVKDFSSVESKTTLHCTGELNHPDITANFRGVKLDDILQTVGVKKEANSIKFQGADNAHYYTTLPLEQAKDKVILAFESDGKKLRPEHGYPVRVVVPGQADKAVKWLQTIELVASN